MKKNFKRQLARVVYTQLKNGRPNWDIPHTKAVVYWAEKITKMLNLTESERKIVVSAAYLHDIGYSFLNVKPNFDSVEEARFDHMKLGAEYSEKILKKLGFENNTIKIVSNIVLFHDDLKKKRDKLEQVLFDADRIAKVDVTRVKPNFNRNDYLKFLEEYEKGEKLLIKFDYSKKVVNELLNKAKSYYK